MEDLLTNLGIPRGSSIFVHASADWSQRAGITLTALCETLLAWIEPSGLLVMPGYPFIGLHEDFLRSVPPVIDLRRAPIRVGLLNEALRRHAGARRGPDGDIPVLAIGSSADEIVGWDPSGVIPCASDSAMARSLDRCSHLVGLGVSWNTNALIHVADAEFHRSYSLPIFTDVVRELSVIDQNDSHHRQARRAIRASVQRSIAPRVILESHRVSPFVRSTTVAGALFWSVDLAAWREEAWRWASASARAGCMPPWLAKLEQCDIAK